MSKKLNLPLALGIFLVGIFSANVSQAQINAYWDVNGVTAGQGGTGTFSSSSVFWTTNSDNATANGGGPTGGGTFAVANGAANSAATYTTNGATWKSNSGAYTFNFGGNTGTVNWGGAYQALGVNVLTSGYIWTIDGNGANTRTITTTNGVNLGANALTLANGARGLNSFTFAGPTPATAVGITGTSGSTLTLRNLVADSAANSFGVYLSGGTISSNIAINVDIGANSKIFLGSQSSGGATINSAIALNTNASGVALNLLNSTSGVVAFNGVISGANGLVLDNSGSGKILLSASNTYSGGTTLNNNSTNGGIITISNAAAFGTGTITSAGAITNYIRAEASGFNITNNVQINSGSTLRLNANNSGWNITSSGEIAGAGSMMFSNSGVNYFLTGTNNSFGGGVSVGNGTLYFNKLGSNGLSSSLGTSGTITVGGPSATTTGGLRWTGTNNETSDKTIVLAGTTGGLFLGAQSSTNASLTLNGNIDSTGAGSKTLTFAGYTNNILTLNGLINETGGVNSVVIGASSSGTVVLGNTANSFSGAVSIVQTTGDQSTVLETAQIGTTGANSTLGKNGTINIGSSAASRATTLRYVGTGEVSDKVINLSGTEGGAILDQSGTSGNLKFTQAITATGVGAKSITLKGATAATGELAGNISDANANVISLVKNERGTWILSGSNSYSGTTTVEAKDGAGSFLKLMATNALSTKTSLLGANSFSNVGTVNFGVAGDYTANSFGISSTGGNNMAFTNSSGGAVSLTFTNANNYFTTGTAGGKTLTNSSANLNIIFKDLDIGSSEANDLTFGGAGNFRVDGALTSTGAGVRGLTKTGAGTLTLAGAGNSYAGATAVNGGTLLLTNSATLTQSTALTVSTSGYTDSSSSGRTVNATLNLASGSTLLSGSTTTVYSGGNFIANGTAGAVVLESNGLLGGSGRVGAITGAGTVGPGNSPGILTAVSVNPTAGTDFKFEFTSLNPTYTSATASGNDLLHLTASSSPFAGGLFTSGNIVSIYLNSATITASLLAGTSTTFSGGFFVDGTYALSSALTPASFAYYTTSADLGTGSAVDYNGTNYYLLNSTIAAKTTLSDTAVTGAQFATGTVSGTLLTFNAVPEPSTGSMLGLGLAGLVVTRLLRRKIS